MNLIKRFWTNLKNSFYNPSFYSSLKNQPLKKGIKFIIALSTLYVILVAASISILILPQLKKISVSDYVDANYPQNLEITIKDGLVKTNVEEPYTIPIPENDKAEGFKNLLTIDTTKDVSLDAVKNSGSVVYLSKDTLIINKSDQELRAISLSKVKDTTLNKDVVKRLGVKFLHYFWLGLPLIILFGVLLGIVFIAASYLLFLVIGAFVPMLIAKFKHQKLTYKEAYKLSLFMVAPVIILDNIATLLNIRSLSFIGMILVLAIVSFVNIKNSKNLSTI